MPFHEELLEDGEFIWEAQKEHPFVQELARGALNQDAFRHWVKQDYRYLLDYARVFAIAGARAREETTMTNLMGIAHSTLSHEMELHREFASDYGISRHELERVQKSPTCQAYTDFLVRTAYEGTPAELSAAIYPCGRGYLDIGEYTAGLADEEHRYTPWIEMYTSDEFRNAVDLMQGWVNRCAEDYPGERDAMREAFLTSARLEYAFWEMAYSEESWVF